MEERIWRVMQRHLRYTDKEMKLFRSDPRNADVLAKSAALMDKTIVARVVEAHGCNSRHQVGDEFYFDGAGNLLTKLCPSRICIHALHPLSGLIFAANELLYAGVDPNEMRFKRVDCLDVSLQCGGWGRVVMEIRVQDRETAPVQA
jgi:uncharacterized repeat protein (TIGR04076 family)